MNADAIVADLRMKMQISIEQMPRRVRAGIRFAAAEVKISARSVSISVVRRDKIMLTRPTRKELLPNPLIFYHSDLQ